MPCLVLAQELYDFTDDSSLQIPWEAKVLLQSLFKCPNKNRDRVPGAFISNACYTADELIICCALLLVGIVRDHVETFNLGSRMSPLSG